MKTSEVEMTEEIADFLTELRDSNVTNMMGAAPYLQEEFGFTSSEARELVLLWMQSI